MHPVDIKLIQEHGDIPQDYEIWIPENGIDNFLKTEFTCGNCFYLALAIHQKTKWPIKAKVVGDDVIHCYVVNKNGKAVDIYGVRPTEHAPTRYDSNIDYSFNVIDLKPETPDESNKDYQWAKELVTIFPEYFGI